ncbi:hypothetical protein BDK51DRAFT_47041, partial [Blyttiomyces helicus]
MQVAADAGSAPATASFEPAIREAVGKRKADPEVVDGAGGSKKKYKIVNLFDTASRLAKRKRYNPYLWLDSNELSDADFSDWTVIESDDDTPPRWITARQQNIIELRRGRRAASRSNKNKSSGADGSKKVVNVIDAERLAKRKLDNPQIKLDENKISDAEFSDWTVIDSHDDEPPRYITSLQLNVIESHRGWHATARRKKKKSARARTADRFATVLNTPVASAAQPEPKRRRLSGSEPSAAPDGAATAAWSSEDGDEEEESDSSFLWMDIGQSGLDFSDVDGRENSDDGNASKLREMARRNRRRQTETHQYTFRPIFELDRPCELTFPRPNVFRVSIPPRLMPYSLFPSSAPPRITARHRQELVEALREWFKSYQEFLARHDAFTSTAFISHGGGRSESIDGEYVLTSSQTITDVAIAGILKAIKDKTEVLVIFGNKYPPLRNELKSRFVIGGWYRPTHCWPQVERSAVDPKMTVTRFKTRFEYVGPAEEAWLPHSSKPGPKRARRAEAAKPVPTATCAASDPSGARRSPRTTSRSPSAPDATRFLDAGNGYGGSVANCITYTPQLNLEIGDSPVKGDRGPQSTDWKSRSGCHSLKEKTEVVVLLSFTKIGNETLPITTYIFPNGGRIDHILAARNSELFKKATEALKEGAGPAGGVFERQ